VVPTQDKHSFYIRSASHNQLTGLQNHENPTTPEYINSSIFKLKNC